MNYIFLKSGQMPNEFFKADATCSAVSISCCKLNLLYFCSQPKPVFNSVNRKFNHQRYQQEEITPQHEELVTYVFDCKKKLYEFRIPKIDLKTHKKICKRNHVFQQNNRSF